MKIQRAKPSDTAIIVDIGRKTFAESHPNCCEPADFAAYLDTSFAPKKIQSELNEPQNIFHLLYVDDELAGYSKIIPNYIGLGVTEPHVTRLERIYIYQKFLNQKVGSALFEFLIEESKKLNQVGMLLGVWVENHRAIEFYKRKGFEICGETMFRLSPTRANPNHVMYLKF